MHVLLVAEEGEARRLRAGVLRDMGYTVEETADGAAARAAWERAQPSLVVLDCETPGLDALALVRDVRAAALDPATFILVVTAQDSSDELGAVLDAGADDYLSMPVTPENLRARLTIAARRIAQEQARRAAEAALARAKWLAGIGETTLALQHEINNPLAALLGNAALIEAGIVTSPEEQRECIAIISEQARRITTVVKRLSTLRDPRSVEYLQGAKMIDLSKDEEA